MPVWDYKCPKCGTVREATFHTVQQRDMAVVMCRVCEDVVMDLLPAAGAFVVNGHNAKNGYAKESA